MERWRMMIWVVPARRVIILRIGRIRGPCLDEGADASPDAPGGSAMDPATAGMVGGIVGGAIGVVGGLIGTYYGIANTKTMAERRFMIRVSVVGWLLMLLFVALPIVLVAMKTMPAWAYWVIFPIFMTTWMRCLPLVNRRAAELRG
jgi:hypothetical protein